MIDQGRLVMTSTCIGWLVLFATLVIPSIRAGGCRNWCLGTCWRSWIPEPILSPIRVHFRLGDRASLRWTLRDRFGSSGVANPLRTCWLLIPNHIGCLFLSCGYRKVIYTLLVTHFDLRPLLVSLPPLSRRWLPRPPQASN